MADYNEIVANAMLEIEESDGLASLAFYRETVTDRDSLEPERMAKIVAKVTLPVTRLASVKSLLHDPRRFRFR